MVHGVLPADQASLQSRPHKLSLRQTRRALSSNLANASADADLEDGDAGSARTSRTSGGPNPADAVGKTDIGLTSIFTYASSVDINGAPDISRKGADVAVRQEARRYFKWVNERARHRR